MGERALCPTRQQNFKSCEVCFGKLVPTNSRDILASETILAGGESLGGVRGEGADQKESGNKDDIVSAALEESCHHQQRRIEELLFRSDKAQ